MFHQHYQALPRKFDSDQHVILLPTDGHVRRRIRPKNLNERIRRCKSAGGPAAINNFAQKSDTNYEDIYFHASHLSSKQPSISALQFSKNIISKIPGYSKVNGCSKKINGCSSDVGRTSYFAHSTSMTLPKHLHLTLRYLQEVIRASKVSQYSGSSTALLDSLLQPISNNLKSSDNRLNQLKDAINTLFNWLDDQIYENFSTTLANKPAEQSTEATQVGLKHLASLEKCLLKIFSGKEGAQFQDDTLIPSNNDSSSNHQTDNSASRSTKMPVTERNEVIASNVNIIPPNDSYFCDTAINQLIEQLRLRKIERFEPKFPELAKPEDDDSDDSDSGVQIDEEREEREEQTHANVCEERIERESDREIRTRKTRTVKTSQTKKCVTIRTQGTVKLSSDDFESFKDDSNLECSKIFAAKFPQKSAEIARDLSDNFKLPKLQQETEIHSNLDDTINNGNSLKAA